MPLLHHHHRMLLSSLLLLCLAKTVAALSLTGSTITVNSIYYFIPPKPVLTISLPSGFKTNQGIVPMVAVIGDVTSATFKGFAAEDDVYQAAFQKVLYVQYNNTNSNNKVSTNTILVSAKINIPQGPYFLDSSTGKIYQAYRLYSDFTGAFSETLFPNSDGSFSVLPANVPGQHLAVAVPSRLYYTKTSAQPLAGVRIGIKDIYDIAGARTSNGNRAWYHFYPAATITAVAVQRLIDAGAVIVGKMITSQFANGETATADWVDYHEPFNPRGDGYQDTSSSSSGPGAGTGAYPWLDITLGSDTGGSIRGPSNVQGLYGNRPSHDLVSLDGVMPLAPQLDTAGFLCRDPAIWSAAADVMYGGLQHYNKFPKQILTIGFPAANDTSSVGNILLNQFLSNVTSFLGTNGSSPINLVSAFAANPPANTPSTNLSIMLNLTYPMLISKEQTMLVRDPFYAAYAAANGGRLPFVDPAPLVRWGFGDGYPASALTDAITNKTVFMDWFNSNILIPTPDSATCSDKILMYIGNNAGTNYRNVYRAAPTVPFGFSNGRISVFTECPDFVIPIGQAPYVSTITGVTEYLPVTVDILVAKGCDGMLFDLIQALEKAGIVGVSLTGRTLQGGDDVLFKRDFGFKERGLGVFSNMAAAGSGAQ